MATQYSFTTLDSLLPASSAVYGMNDVGQIVGIRYDDSTQIGHGLVYRNGTFHTVDFQATNAFDTNRLTDINNAGRIPGVWSVPVVQGLTQGFIYDNGIIKTANHEVFDGINNPGQVVSLTVFQTFPNTPQARLSNPPY